ncbi:hypothetical protein BFJ65_g6801 [Fusarium oxysporum f. sp. cepae]|uniref:Uncharacterized protein n=1 Tax=Fusarium oxysporum f. sp. cepae TaxID=396571 RepID=A0A3L6NQ45_FUSOX|nr:hypothetical protein BFJ65_g6801 [Fusarium oxysporum f. sp. cepae]
MTGTSATNEDQEADTEKKEERKNDKPDAVDVSWGSGVSSGFIVVASMAGGVLVAGLW